MSKSPSSVRTACPSCGSIIGHDVPDGRYCDNCHTLTFSRTAMVTMSESERQQAEAYETAAVMQRKNAQAAKAEQKKNRLPVLIGELSRLSRPEYEFSRAELAKKENVRPEFLDEIYKRARSKSRGDRPESSPDNVEKTRNGANPKHVPFRILGVADDGLAYFLDDYSRLQSFRPSGITKGQLLQLGDLNSFWYREFGHKGHVQWDDATNWIVRESSARSFDLSVIRGRGAWRERDGSICYHDGQETYGTPDPTRIYQKKSRLDLGLESNPAGDSVRQQMLRAAGMLSFETKADAARLLAWSALAPFCGALPWRPAGFVTGPSKSGKSTILSMIVRKLALPLAVSGGATDAYIRQKLGLDALPVVIDEAEGADETDRHRMEGILSLMRQSTSDDAPLIGKGSTSGKPIEFLTRSMFLFNAISPNVGKLADANRLFTVDLVRPENNWHAIRDSIKDAFTDSNCAGVRVATWKLLPEIIAEAERISDFVGEVTLMDSRYALQEAILWATFWLVWKGERASDDTLRTWLASVYDQKAPEEQEDEADGMLSRLMDEVVQVSGKPSERVRIGKIIDRLLDVADEDELMPAPVSGDDRRYYKTTLENYGLRLTREGTLAIAIHNPQLERVWGQRGYAKVLMRHPSCIERNKNVRNVRCMVISASATSREEIPI